MEEEQIYNLAEKLADEVYGEKGYIFYSERQELTNKFNDLLTIELKKCTLPKAYTYMQLTEKELRTVGEPAHILTLDLSAFAIDDTIRQRRIITRIMAMCNIICQFDNKGWANYINVANLEVLASINTDVIAGMPIILNENLEHSVKETNIIVGRYVEGGENVYMELTVIL